MSKFEDEMLEALELCIKEGISISLDAVAIKSGRMRGALRRNMVRHKDLIRNIDDAREKHQQKQEESKEAQLERQIEKLRNDRTKFKKQYEEALAREVSYIWKIQSLTDDLNDHKVKDAKERARLKEEGKLVRLVK